MGKSRFETGLRLLLYGGMIAVSVIFLLRPINDPDFFWHLKTGEWIWQHRELPSQDQFNYTSPATEPAKQRFVLTSYWLSQVSYHLIHGLLGFPGIVVLKLCIAALYVMALLKLRRGDPLVHASLVLAVLPLLFGLYPFDRPQALSFLFFAVLLVLLEKERTSAAIRSGWRSLLPIPLLLLVWANSHGGHVVGQATLALYIALEGLKFLHPILQPVGPRRYRRLLIAGIAGLVVSLINPNSYHVFSIAQIPMTAGFTNFEYLSTVRFFRDMQQPLILLFWGALALAAVSCASSIARPDITWIVLLAGTGYHGFRHVRYVPFFMICAVLAISASLSPGRVGKWTRLVAVAGSVVLAAYFCRNIIPTRERVGAALRVNEALYPVRAVDFVLANDLKGNLYNTYIWGGYLIWRLAPERKVFVDGRGVNWQPIYDSSAINEAFAGPNALHPYWKNLLERNGVGYLIIPRVRKLQGMLLEDTGRFAAALLKDPEWVPVFADEIALVFVKSTPEHRDVIARHGLPKERPLGWWQRNDLARGDQLVREGRREEAAAAYREAIRSEPGNVDAWHNLGCVLGELGRLDEAATAFEETLRLKPDHPTARKNLERIPSRSGR